MICPSHVYDFLLFVSESSRIFEEDAELQLALADQFFKMKFAFAFGILNVGHLKRIVIKVWISSLVFFEQNNVLVS